MTSAAIKEIVTEFIKPLLRPICWVRGHAEYIYAPLKSTMGTLYYRETCSRCSKFIGMYTIGSKFTRDIVEFKRGLNAQPKTDR